MLNTKPFFFVVFIACLIFILGTAAYCAAVHNHKTNNIKPIAITSQIIILP